MIRKLLIVFAFLTGLSFKGLAVTDYMLTANDGNVVPESPRAARFLEVTAPRAALVTGATQFDVPLYTLSVQELSLNFALKYLSNGVKVFDDPCPVSYGWSLLPALRVTRRINGRPDEFFPYLEDISHNTVGPAPDYTTLYRCVTDSGLYSRSNYTSVNRYDAEKDIFTIHLPDRNVTCMADFKNGTPRFIAINADDIRITGDAGLNFIRVTDNKGTVFEFGRRGEYCDNDLYCNEWLLTEINLLSGDKVNLTWKENNHVGKNHRELAPNTLSCSKKESDSFFGNYELSIGADGENPLNVTGNFHNHLELENVTFPGGSIHLSYTRSTKGPHLTYFSVKNSQNDIVKTVTLSYNDLLLRSVDISGVGKYDFGYYEYGRLTNFCQDLWGFYNGDTTAFTLVPEMELRHSPERSYQSSIGSSRHSDEYFMRHRLLNKVVYPTGGYTRWEHEAHRFAARPDSVWEQMTFSTYVKEDVKFESGGGLRVKSITTGTDSTDTKPIVTSYVYGTDGDGYANCKVFPFLYTFVTGDRHLSAVWNDYNTAGLPITSATPELVESYNLTINTSSNYLKYHYGSPIWYNQVTELSAVGKTEHFFEEFITDQISANWLNPIPQALFSMASKGPVETKTIAYKGTESAFTKVSTTDLQYEIVQTPQSGTESGWTISRLITQSQSEDRRIVPDFGETGEVDLSDEIGFNPDQITIRNPLHVDVGEWGEAYSPALYTIHLQQERLVSQTTTQHFDNGDMTSTVSFEYLDCSETPSKVTATLPDGSMRTVNLYYPVKGNSVWERMLDLNLGHTPVRTTLTEKIGGKTAVKTVANNYALSGTGMVPRVSQTSAWRDNSTHVVLASYSYDRRGNLLTRTSRDSVTTEWTWDSEGLYPLSQTVGSRLTSSYSWKSLVGMTSQTTPAGLTTNYSYDSDGRLVTETLDGYGTLATYRYFLNRGCSRIESDRWLDSDGLRRATSKVLYDGLGRQWLTIASNVGGATTNVATLTEYDAMSRPFRQWSPAPIATGTTPADATEVASLAASHYEDDYPYTLIEYEPDERRMVKAQTPPGAAWHTADKAVRTRTLTNVATKGSPYACPLFSVGTGRSVTYEGLAPAGTLSVTEVIDEDGVRTLTFTDARGRTVMTRTGADDDFSDTRFVYNGYDDLLCVLPPMLADKGYQSGDADLMAYAYFYDYDDRGQCVAKKLPGREELRMFYDPAGRLVATQDGIQRKQLTWTVYMFDQFGREALSGTAGATTDEIEDFVSRINHVVYTGDPELVGYSTAFPILFTIDVESAEYYDDYSFTSLCPSLIPDPSTALTATLRPTAPGLRTGGYSGGERYETVYYDAQCRPVFTSANTGVGLATTVNEYTYTGQVRKTVSTARGTTLTTRYTFDSADRPVSVSSDIDGLPVDTPTASTALTYGLTGQLEKVRFGPRVTQSVTRDCGGRETSRTVSLPFEMKIPSVAGVQNATGLTPTLPGFGGEVSELTRDITEVLRYANATVPAYNGNVGQRVYDDASVSYVYDGHNRLTKAAYRSTGNVENFSTEYAYDRQANLTRLKKWGLYEPSTGDCALIDDLHISYDGNQAVRVEDYGENPVFEGAGGYNAPDGVGTMTYDDNGNLTSDSGRGITRIEYNRFNLPTAIYFGDGHRQTISYDGRGAKLSVTYSTATSPVLASGTARRYRTDFVRRYGAGRVVRGDSVEMVMHPYGYFDGEGRVRYYLHDFQGNVTMVVDNEGEVLQHTRYYPYGEAIDVFATSAVANTPTADRAQPYLYGGKELERMHGLGEYDYGARRLQSHLPMWTTQDPCLEKYYSASPYAYCAANPLRFIDPSGCAQIVYRGEIIGNDGLDDGRILVIPDVDKNYTENDKTIPSAGSSKKVTKALVEFVKANSGNAEAFTDDEDVYNMLQEIVSSSENVQGMIEEISKDDGQGGTKESNNREYGGYLTENGVEIETPGSVGSPLEGASIPMYQYKDSFHSHPSGSIPGYGYTQHPSLADITNIESHRTVHYVFGRGNNTVYIYTKRGIVATINQDKFKKIYNIK